MLQNRCTETPSAAQAFINRTTSPSARISRHPGPKLLINHLPFRFPKIQHFYVQLVSANRWRPQVAATVRKNQRFFVNENNMYVYCLMPACLKYCSGDLRSPPLLHNISHSFSYKIQTNFTFISLVQIHHPNLSHVYARHPVNINTGKGGTPHGRKKAGADAG